MCKTIDSDIRAILALMEVENDIVKPYPKQLDRATYVRLNKVLEALGGKWKRGKGHVFAKGAAVELLADAVASGVYESEQQKYQNFATPSTLAKELVAKAGKPKKVLEPSCGEGAIVDALLDAGIKQIEVCELRDGCVEKMEAKGAEVLHEGDFLLTEPDEFFDAVVMNPPFTQSQDMAHVRHAFDHLKPGGTLVSIMSTGFTFRSDKKATAFREWAEEVGADWEENEPGAFKESGTLVSTVTFTVKKAA